MNAEGQFDRGEIWLVEVTEPVEGLGGRPVRPPLIPHLRAGSAWFVH